tara:strand:- start:342 stop:599 length:258 start_codon:yes stop_codon:yes gene_type:complete
MEQEKISSLILTILGIIIVIDGILQYFNIGIKQDSLVMGYCIAFIFISIKFPNILKKKTRYNSYVYNDITNALFFNCNIYLIKIK